jgi:hypothetical protein
VAVTDWHDLRLSHFDFDSRLRLQTITPASTLQEKLKAELPANATATERLAHTMKRFGHVKYLVNEFDR